MIRLIAGPAANSLPPIVDPDPLIPCDLMDGRDAFLTLARDKHLEFSSLRRAQWSTMCMLVELHSQSQDCFVYTCKHHVETRWHCTIFKVGPRGGEQRALEGPCLRAVVQQIHLEHLHSVPGQIAHKDGMRPFLTFVPIMC